MGNLVTGHANKIIVGPARILIAVLGTTEPPTNVDPVVWDAAWKEVGYTDDGLQFVYNPTFKDTTVDEEMAPIDSFLNGETATLSCKIAEPTLDNLANAISACTKTTVAAATGVPGTTKVVFGSGDRKFVMIGFEGLAPAGTLTSKPWRIFVGHKAIAKGNVTMAMKRADKTIIPVLFNLFADSAQAAGAKLGYYVDKTAEPL
jgi:hypothetical protein